MDHRYGGDDTLMRQEALNITYDTNQTSLGFSILSNERQYWSQTPPFLW